MCYCRRFKAGYVNKSDDNYVGVACIVGDDIYLALTSGAYVYDGRVTGLNSDQLDKMIEESADRVTAIKSAKTVQARYYDIDEDKFVTDEGVTVPSLD